MNEPHNELGVIVFFVQDCASRAIEIIDIQAAFPDVTIRMGDQVLRCEFEYRSSDFWNHGHDMRECDAIICWDHDTETCLPVIAISNREWETSQFEIPDRKSAAIEFWRRRALQAERRISRLESTLEELQDSPDRFPCLFPGCTFVGSSQQALNGHQRKHSNRSNGKEPEKVREVL